MVYPALKVPPTIKMPINLCILINAPSNYGTHFLVHPGKLAVAQLETISASASRVAPAAVKGFAAVAVASFVVAIIIFGMQTKAHINL